MPTYIALLRGVNVGGNLLKMERLRELLTEIGFADVRTYVQSGNAVFDSDEPASKALRMIEAALAGATRLAVSVVLRTDVELKAIIRHNPFLKDKKIDRSKLHVTFVDAPVSKQAITSLSAIKSGNDEFRVIGSEVYLYCPDGYGKSKLSNNIIQKVTGATATTRNWSTVNRLFEMASK